MLLRWIRSLIGGLSTLLYILITALAIAIIGLSVFIIITTLG